MIPTVCRYLAAQQPVSKGIDCRATLRNSSAMEIRPLQTSQINAVARFYHAVWHETHAACQDPRVVIPRTVPFFAARLQNWQETTIVAFTDETPIGLVSWTKTHLEALFVGPQHRSCGLGAKLLGRAEAAMFKNHGQQLTLKCLCANRAGRRFYEGHGWRVKQQVDEVAGLEAWKFTPHWLMVKP